MVKKRPRADGTDDDGENAKIQVQGISVKISFIDKDDSFINIKWTLLNESLNTSTDQWEFLAFGSDYKSAIISAFNQQTFEILQKDVTFIKVNDNKHNILLEELKPDLKRGIIYNKFLIPNTDDEIKEELNSQGIEEFYRIQKVDLNSNQKVYTGSVILTIPKSFTLTYVIVGKIQIPINSLTPKPMFCNHCGILGHTAKKCRKAEIELCPKCYFDHESDDPCNVQCKNCDGSHLSNFKKCVTLKKEIKILKIKESHCINYFDAKKIVDNTVEEIDEAINNNENQRKTDLIKKLLEDKRKLLEELKVERETSKSHVEEINHLKKEIPLIKKKFIEYKTENDEKVKELQEILEQEIAKNAEDVSALTKENVKTNNENKSLIQKLGELQSKYNNLEEKGNGILF